MPLRGGRTPPDSWITSNNASPNSRGARPAASVYWATSIRWERQLETTRDVCRTGDRGLPATSHGSTIPIKDVSTPSLKRLMDTERVQAQGGRQDGQSCGGLRSPLQCHLAAPVTKAPAPLERTGIAPDSQRTEKLGRYHLEREIGRGAMGIGLSRPRHRHQPTWWRSKPFRWRAEFSDAELVEARSRFFREAETAGRLNHPNIVTIYDVGEERGLAYIAMEYLKGPGILSDYAKPPTTCSEPRKVLGDCGDAPPMP